MKKLLSIVSIFSVALSLQLQAQTNKTPFLTKPLTGTIKNVKAQTSGGSITIEGIDTGEPRLEVYVHSNDKHNELTKEQIQKKLDEDYTIEILTTNQQLTVIAKQKNKITNWKNALSISFKVFSPKNISTELNTSGGSISISNVSGNQDFNTSGGSLQVQHVTGRIKGRTSGGSIEVADCDNDIDLSTSGGSIAAKNCTGKINLHTSGGSVQLKNLKGNVQARTSGGNVHGKDISGEIDAHTSGGNMDFEDVSGNLEASTSGGNIEVNITTLDKYLTLHNSGGSVSLTVPKNQGLDIDLKGDHVKSSEMNNFSGTMEDDQLKGKINGGGASVTVKGNGNVRLAFK